MREFILPIRIAETSYDRKNAENLLRAKPMQIGLNERDLAEFSGGGYIVFDFGKELHGGARILTYFAQGGPVRLRFGESLSETYSETGSKEFAATNDHSNRDFCVSLQNYSDMSFAQTGFRFLRIDFPENTNVKMKSVYAVSEMSDSAVRGNFECSDSLVNEIFRTAAYTVRLCMQNGVIWDGIKRDRLVWIGDMHPEILSIMSLFGADDSVERSLDFVREQSPLPGFMNNMPAYSLWWLSILSDYYMQNKNDEYLHKVKDYLMGLVKVIDGRVSDDGFLDFVKEDYFLDWPTAGKPEAKAGVYALCSFALKKAELLFDALGEDKEILRKIDARLDKTQSSRGVKQVSAIRYLGGHEDKSTVAATLMKGGAKGLSTFQSFYILSAINETVGGKQALDIMKEYYGAMLSRGATSFWEDFDMSWLENTGRIDELPKKGQKDIHGDFGAFCYKGFRHSLCHGWSSGPVPYLMRYILGIQVLEPGCKKVRIKPDLCGLEYAKGEYPTPFGNISVSVTNRNGKQETDIKSPKNIEIVR